MTEKELRKLRRQDFLELLVEQSRETSRLNIALQEREEELRIAMESVGRLKDKLNGKDEQLKTLKGRLDEKDAEQEGKAAEAEEQLNRLKEKLDLKDNEIEKLRKQADRKEERIEALEEEVERYRSNRWKEMKESGLSAELLETLKSLL